jgi:hypothetical protein
LSIFEGHPKMLTKTEPKRPTIAVGGLFGFILLLPLQLMAAALHRRSRKRFDARPLLLSTVRDRLGSRCNAAEGEEADEVGAYFPRKLLIIRSDVFRPTLTLFSQLCLCVLIYGFPLSSVLGQASTLGQWSTASTWKVEAIHAHLLPILPNGSLGKVLVWGKGYPGTSDPPQVYVWDVAGNTFTQAPIPASSPGNTFCGGHAFLSDGTLLVTGGHSSNYNGLKKTNKYNPSASGPGSWTPGLPDMIDKRWYPTTTALPNGEALVISGEITGNPPTYNRTPEVWQAGSNRWRPLNKADLGLPYYPYMFVAPQNEKVFLAGPNQLTRYLDTAANFTGTTRWHPVANLNYYPRDWGSAVMYAPGKVLIMGGTTCGWYVGNCSPTAVTATAELIDLTSAQPNWTYTGNMVTGARKLHNATLLPNGNVFVSGGSNGTEDPNARPAPSNFVLPCDMWTPPPAGSTELGQWSQKASLPGFRGYHSIALLLPDGRVLSAGGDKATAPNGGPLSAELYSPEYLFDSNNQPIPNTSRPTISAVPTTIGYGSTTFTVNTSNASSIFKVTLVALGSVTHGFNMGQRFVNLSFMRGSGTLTVTPPSGPNLAPPGYYMLFILNNRGVPSIAKMIQLH